MIVSVSGAAGARYSDDVYTFALDPVTLTVTPRSAPNSLESGGICIDGGDTGVQPIPPGALGPTAGTIRWSMRWRHADGDFLDFEDVTPPFVAWFSAPVANYITVDCSAANTIRLEVFSGGAASNGVVVNPGIVVDTDTAFEIVYTATQIQLLIDSVVQITVVAAVDFLADIPTAAYWGSDPAGTHQVDAVFL